jgi:hypothetical protein
LHIGSTVPVFTQSIRYKKLMAFFLRFSQPGGRSNPATFRIPQVATRPADAVNLKSKNTSVRRAAEVQKVQLFGSGLGHYERNYGFDDQKSKCAFGRRCNKITFGAARDRRAVCQ